ncbi:hypothetical protein A0H81_12089 [Grifola frondosa]|uniref:C2H2-type domain-containing protein n=1 Tax=Grifola frondosa TaxID=5627 RepID=A0A1C7LSU9_GRIFR|nr:hypothetical protein A0H81_12089 [Grifola frondosa]
MPSNHQCQFCLQNLPTLQGLQSHLTQKRSCRDALREVVQQKHRIAASAASSDINQLSDVDIEENSESRTNLHPASSASEDASHRVRVEEVEDEEAGGLPKKPWVKDFPTEAASILDHRKTSFETIRDQKGEAGDSSWAPFTCKEEWELAKWLMSTGLSQNAVRITSRCQLYTQNRTKLSFHNKRAFFQKIDTLPWGPGWVCEPIEVTGDLKDDKGHTQVEEVELWKRDPVECIQELIGNPVFKDLIQYAPERLYSDSEGSERIYDEMWTADWWWDTQENCPKVRSPTKLGDPIYSTMKEPEEVLRIIAEAARGERPAEFKQYGLVYSAFWSDLPHCKSSHASHPTPPPASQGAFRQLAISLNDAWTNFHANKHVFDYGVREHFNIPKFHSTCHYESSIRQLGTADGYNTEGSNASISTTLNKQAVQRFHAYLQWVESLSLHMPSHAPGGDRVDDDDMDNGGDTVDDTSNHLDMQPTPATAYSVAKEPGLPNTPVHSLQNDFGCVDFVRALEHFLRHSSGTQTLPPAAQNISSTTRFSVYKHKLIRAMPKQATSGLRKAVPAHFDTGWPGSYQEMTEGIR